MNSGIYKITNTVSGDFYVGSAVDLDRRCSRHFCVLRNGKHENSHLQRAYDKYGESVFVFSVLEYCEKERLIEGEQFYIDTLFPEYNIAPKAGSQLGLRHSAEARAKIGAAQKGKVVSANSRLKMSAAQRKRKLLSPATFDMIQCILENVINSPDRRKQAEYHLSQFRQIVEKR